MQASRNRARQLSFDRGEILRLQDQTAEILTCPGDGSIEKAVGVVGREFMQARYGE